MLNYGWRDRGHNPACSKSSELIRRNVVKNREVLSTFDWQLTKPRESICEHVIAHRVTGWPPFYLIILEPNEIYVAPAR